MSVAELVKSKLASQQVPEPAWSDPPEERFVSRCDTDYEPAPSGTKTGASIGDILAAVFGCIGCGVITFIVIGGIAFILVR